MQNPERDPYRHAHVMLDKGVKAIQWRKKSLFNTWFQSNWKSTGKQQQEQQKTAQSVSHTLHKK